MSQLYTITVRDDSNVIGPVKTLGIYTDLEKAHEDIVKHPFLQRGYDKNRNRYSTYANGTRYTFDITSTTLNTMDHTDYF